MMHMTLYWGKKVTILFDSWKTDSWTSYFLSLLACFLVSVFYQYMEDRRLRFKLLSVKTQKLSNGSAALNSPLLLSNFASRGGKWAASRFAGAILFGVNSAIGYLLMLAIMSFNGGVFIAVVVGLAIGYLVFRCSDEEVVVVEDNSCACS
ncbi:copper transporter 5.1-like [Olea europaea var. sylvestris]|uniref:Copper transport protein n=1 Tax=Olea europaea subsp. europaea TaxID=158383 RepID=A0A8S0QA11_OLEEU|nr:copper transporter 5.1-like [Olea europaea var. sylvestris]CAA2961610.1 copper transporter 5 [Olea europaea subsp. europaea]